MICPQCGEAFAPEAGLELMASGLAEPLVFDSHDCMLAWLQAHGLEQAAADLSHGLWVLQEGIDGFPPLETGA